MKHPFKNGDEDTGIAMLNTGEAFVELDRRGVFYLVCANPAFIDAAYEAGAAAIGSYARLTRDEVAGLRDILSAWLKQRGD